jgi:hypothetical protein
MDPPGLSGASKTCLCLPLSQPDTRNGQALRTLLTACEPQPSAFLKTQWDTMTHSVGQVQLHCQGQGSPWQPIKLGLCRWPSGPHSQALGQRLYLRSTPTPGLAASLGFSPSTALPLCRCDVPQPALGGLLHSPVTCTKRGEHCYVDRCVSAPKED